MRLRGASHIVLISVIVASALLVAALANLQLYKDGSSYLFELVLTDSAVRHGRLGAYIVQLPSIAAAKLLDLLHVEAFTRLATQRLLFCLNYAAVPLLAVLSSWFLVRGKHEALFVWSALIVLFINLVNFSWVSELLIAMQLACPLMLACFLYPERKLTWLLAPALAAWMFFLHPLSFLLFLAVGAGCFIAGYGCETVRRPAFALGAALLVAAAVRGSWSLLVMTRYERSMVKLDSMQDYLFVTSLSNIVLLLSALIIGLRRLRMPGRGFRVDVGLAILATAILIAHFFVGAERFPLKTGLALFAAIAVIIFASLDSHRAVPAAEGEQRRKLALVLALCFAAVIAAKSWIWHDSVSELEHALAAKATTCVERAHSDFQWLGRRPHNIIDDWALPSLVLVKQMGNPAQYLLAAGDCATLQGSQQVRVDPWTTLKTTELRRFTLREPALR